jgi:hypothetical protein
MCKKQDFTITSLQPLSSSVVSFYNGNVIPHDEVLRLRRAKRVRFEDGEDASQGTLSNKRRIIEYLPLCSELEQEEKVARWLQVEDKIRINQDANSDAQICRRDDNRLLLRGQACMTFSEIYATVHSLCLQSVTQESDSVLETITDDVLMHLTVRGARGLEDRTVPRKALERRVLRQHSIAAVLAAQQKYQGNADKIREVSMAFTLPSRKFSEILGMVDATAAMIEYRSMALSLPSLEEIQQSKINNSAENCTVYEIQSNEITAVSA